MKVIFSRKGFDSSSGGAPSPIVDGVPVSLPIPTDHRSSTTYEDIGYGELVERVTKGRISGSHLCHLDPMFENGRCAFGQTGAAQSHLKNNEVGVGDLFLFFGLFSDPFGENRHHRIFGYLKIGQISYLGRRAGENQSPEGFSIRHPHTIGDWNENNCIYIGTGNTAKAAKDEFRLTEKDASSVSNWLVPTWLKHVGLTYHQNPNRWSGNTLRAVNRGQEFVADLSSSRDGRDWVNNIVEAIEHSNVE